MDGWIDRLDGLVDVCARRQRQQEIERELVVSIAIPPSFVVVSLSLAHVLSPSLARSRALSLAPSTMSAKKAAAMFEQAAADSTKVQTNAKVKTVKTWYASSSILALSRSLTDSRAARSTHQDAARRRCPYQAWLPAPSHQGRICWSAGQALARRFAVSVHGSDQSHPPRASSATIHDYPIYPSIPIAT